jgi:hypothetical protein
MVKTSGIGICQYCNALAFIDLQSIIRRLAFLSYHDERIQVVKYLAVKKRNLSDGSIVSFTGDLV